jgi:hypothetical protein
MTADWDRPRHRHRGPAPLAVQVPRSAKDHRQQELGFHAAAARRLRQAAAGGQGQGRRRLCAVPYQPRQDQGQRAPLPGRIRFRGRGLETGRHVKVVAGRTGLLASRAYALAAGGERVKLYGIHARTMLRFSECNAVNMMAYMIYLLRRVSIAPTLNTETPNAMQLNY